MNHSTQNAASRAGSAPAGLEVRDVRVVYPGTPPVVAVEGATLSVAPGETVALLGPSGCGKSSLLGAIVGIVPVAAGAILWDGSDVTAVPVHRRGFGLVFQDGQLFPHRSLARNVAFGLEMAGIAREERRARVEELLDLVGLEGYGARAVTELSGGQRQRVALARSLAPRPRLLALDEPLSSLDADLRARLAVDVRDILAAAGTAAIVVTHDPAEAEVMASRVLRMADGRLL
ncbi:ABC transporter ATP-binding protein [Demequina sp. NBRC 110053]|uniref:ABC transporter ATP-binding protein n=1 Tax=Demequina sp. NBRC 110053 TaxID=1570342 RepID=UPI0009FDD29D|nr:ABC transporter ATP-binding protein [Demequina sp. NBRC 110053]